MGSFRSGISKGDRQECIPRKCLFFFYLTSLQIYHELATLALYRTQEEHQAISHVFMFKIIVEENRQNVAPETITPQNILLTLIKWPHKYYFVHSV